VDSQLTYFTQPEAPLSKKHYLKCYLPSRTALVFKRQETRKVL
jgi:hypothetical protein